MKDSDRSELSEKNKCRGEKSGGMEAQPFGDCRDEEKGGRIGAQLRRVGHRRSKRRGAGAAPIWRRWNS